MSDPTPISKYELWINGEYVKDLSPYDYRIGDSIVCATGYRVVTSHVQERQINVDDGKVLIFAEEF